MPLIPLQLKRSADLLYTASQTLELLREQIQASDVGNLGLVRIHAVLSKLIESVSIIGENVATIQASMQAAGAILAGQELQCPECGLPIGTNATTDGASGCSTCTAAIEMHRRTQGNKCADCGCLIGTNGENCRRCLDEAYFQRIEATQQETPRRA